MKKKSYIDLFCLEFGGDGSGLFTSLLQEVRHAFKSLSVLIGWFQSVPVHSVTQPNLHLLTTEILYGPDPVVTRFSEICHSCSDLSAILHPCSHLLPWL